jgi:hypothetical protein
LLFCEFDFYAYVLFYFCSDPLHSDSGGDRSIPPLQVENDMIQDDNKKAELFNDYFCKQADLNDSETSVPDITDILL